MLLCKYCKREIKNKGALTGHEKHCRLNINRTQRIKSPLAHTKLGSIPWNKGIPTSLEQRLKISKALLERGPKRVLSKEENDARKLKISITMKNNPKCGGLRHGSGRGKKGWYKGYWCDSSWELAWVIYSLDHGVKFERNLKGFEYEFEGKIHKYYPDFILEDGSFVEVKGRRNKETCDDQTKCKIDAFKHVIILFEKDMNIYLDYVKETYGKDFIKLYENKV